MSYTVAGLLCLFAGADAAAVNTVGGGRGFLGLRTEMQPENVAKTLMSVEDEWKAQAAAFAECTAVVKEADQQDGEACTTATAAFQKSCKTIVNTVIQASSGDRSAVQEYMNEVCGEKVLDAWHQARCSFLSSSVVDSMSVDNYDNREGFDAVKVCTGFWTNFLVEEKERVQKEKEEEQVREKAEAEEREKAAAKAAEEAAERAKQEAEEKAKAEEEKKAQEEAEAKKALAANVTAPATAANVSAAPQASVNSTAGGSRSENKTAVAVSAVSVANVTGANASKLAVAPAENRTAAFANATQTASEPVSTPSNVSEQSVSVVPEATVQNTSVSQKTNTSTPKNTSA